MIDTLKLQTFDYDVKPDNKLITTVSTNCEGELLGERRHFNSDLVQIDVRNSTGLSVKLSVPKVYGLRNNYYPVGQVQYKTVISSVADLMRDIGIVTDIDKMKVSRLDIFRNAQLCYPVLDYSPVLESIYIPRLNYDKTISNSITHLWRNRQRELCFYDKNRELESQGLSKENDENICRGELRLFKNKQVGKLGFTCSESILDNWDKLKTIHSEYMEKVFHRTTLDIEGNEDLGMSKEKVNILSLIKGKGMDKALEVLGVGVILSFFSLDELKIELENNSGVSRAKKYRILAKLRELSDTYKEFMSSDFYTVLYTELQQKFVA